MAKTNPVLLKRPSRPSWDVLLSDPAQPELTFTLKIRALDALGAMDAQTRADVLWETYSPFLPPSQRKLLPLVDNQAIPVSRHACQIVGTLLAAQCALAEDCYTAEEMFCMMASFPIAAQMLAAVNEITDKSAAIEGDNDSPLASESPSSSPGSSSDADTPKPSSNPTDSSEASTTDSNPCAIC